jgi:hypothetical protein
MFCSDEIFRTVLARLREVVPQIQVVEVHIHLTPNTRWDWESGEWTRRLVVPKSGYTSLWDELASRPTSLSNYMLFYDEEDLIE